MIRFRQSVPTAARRGFTIVELMVVIVIIVALVAILLPVFAALRRTAQKTASKAQVTALGTAVTEYERTLGFLPGFFDDAVLATSPAYGHVTSTQNLVLSLLGGVVENSTSPSTDVNPPVSGVTLPSFSAGSVKFDVDSVGKGPIFYHDPSDADNHRQYGAFYAPKKNEVGAARGTEYNGDNTLPTFQDAGSLGLPLLYLRAASVTRSKPVSSNAGGGGDFLRNTVLDYVEAENRQTINGDVYNQHDTSLFSEHALNGGTPIGTTIAEDNLAWVLTSVGLSKVDHAGGSNDKANNDYTDDPANKLDVIAGRYFLIAPGPDGIYFDLNAIGQNGEIRSYSNASLADDAVNSGGG